MRPFERDPMSYLMNRKRRVYSIRSFAAHLGVSAAFVSDIARGNREPSGKVLQYLGLTKDVRRVVIFFKP